jgi:apolipoprotein D and lipocalin family protein
VLAGLVWLTALAAGTGCATTTERLGLPPVRTVSSVDLKKYAGTWYEIAAFPLLAESNCTGVTATYTLREDGEIDVLNRCRKFALDGPEDAVNGRARVVDRATNAKLQVSFFRPFWGDYWIIDLAPDYSYAVVGHPSRDYLWILARSPQLPADTYAGIVKRLQDDQRYPLDRLVRTVQAPAGAAR